MRLRWKGKAKSLIPMFRLLSSWSKGRPFDAAERRPSLEVHIPISPTREMFNMVHALTLSLRRNGGAYADAPVIVTVGDTSYPPELVHAPPPWLARNNVSLNFVPAQVFARYSWSGTALQRFHYDFRSDVVLMLDADILVARSFDELVETVAASQEFAGMIAHMCPFPEGGSAYWRRMYAHAGLGAPELVHEHMSWGALAETEETRYCPLYFNLGVLCAPPPFITHSGRTILGPGVPGEELFGYAFLKCQIALTLSIASANVACQCLPVSFNFHNGPEWEPLHGASLANAVFLHLYSHNPNGFAKTQVYKGLNSLGELVARRDLTGASAAARQILSEVLPQMVSDQESVDERVFGPYRSR